MIKRNLFRRGLFFLIPLGLFSHLQVSGLANWKVQTREFQRVLKFCPLGYVPSLARITSLSGVHSAPLSGYFGFSVLTPNSQNNYYYSSHFIDGNMMLRDIK